ncbi:hypothetical protein CSC62_14035 [Pseudoxanthomonas jiangsuensis]|uniref:VpaChn25_0724 family phage protein n=1 Tax=Pseudoxanthomonas jiangsuensis TaxID=619688 RepID=UPI0013907790|nr:ArsR family transcriptional regulator [Pseudoxanthomonas jiangsuensis]KAF1692750.1 hypothetical protein CSC62_14035 [Pseudoxanthomonas jiangsuensis]
MSKTYNDHLREERRLVLLRLLAEQAGYRANSSTLHAGLSFLAIPGSRDDVNTDLAWLKDQGYVEMTTALEGVHVVTLSIRGHDVATGQAIVPGVRRPGPK